MNDKIKFGLDTYSCFLHISEDLSQTHPPLIFYCFKIQKFEFISLFFHFPVEFGIC